MKMCEFLIASATALIITGNENYGIVAFVLSMLGLLFRTSIEISSRSQDQEKRMQEATKKASEAILTEANNILQKNLNAINIGQKNFN